MIFPSLPTYRVQWTPLYFETIPGSGERFTFAVIAAGEDLQVEIRDVLRPYALRELFGDQGGALHGMLIQQVMTIDDYLKNKGDWQHPPIIMSNIQIGVTRSTLAENLDHAFMQAIRLCACLGESSIGMQAEDKLDLDAPIKDWAKRIKQEVLLMQQSLGASFSLPIATNDPKRPTAKIGFLHHEYAAGFGALHGRTDRISQDVAQIKRRLWDLMQLRYNQLYRPKRMEVIVGHPPFELLTDMPKLTSAILFKLDRIREEARNANIGIYQTDNVRDAAEHIMQQAA